MALKENIKAEALRLGFTLIGFSSPDPPIIPIFTMYCSYCSENHRLAYNSPVDKNNANLFHASRLKNATISDSARACNVFIGIISHLPGKQLTFWLLQPIMQE